MRVNRPLRRLKAAIDLHFVREEVAYCYGKNGNESVAPEVILKMMFLLFFDDIASERELMEVIGERLDYLWFLDYGLDEKVPDHSVPALPMDGLCKDTNQKPDGARNGRRRDEVLW